MEELTKRQYDTLLFIKKFIAKNGFPPSIREIAAGLNLSSPATVFTHIKKLEEKNILKSTGGKSRTIELLVENEYIEGGDEVSKIPLLGMISAGDPVLAIEQPNEFFAIPSNLLPSKKDVFALDVSGESMINKGIHDKDIVIVKKQPSANNGDVVVALTNENEVTLKTFYKEKNHFRLQPENDFLEPIILNEVNILGVAVGLYRKI